MSTKEANGQNIVLQKSADTVAKAVFKSDKGKSETVSFVFLNTLQRHDKNLTPKH